MAKWTVGVAAAAMLLGVCGLVMAGDDKSDAELGLVAINVADLERSEKYYAEVLGFIRAWQYPPDSDDPIEIGLVAPGGGAGLALAHLNDDPLPEGKGGTAGSSSTPRTPRRWRSGPRPRARPCVT